MPEEEHRHRFMKRDIDEELIWSLHCENPSLGRVRELLVQGADINAREPIIGTVLMHAVGDRRVPKEIVKYLVEQCANIKATHGNGDSVLMKALWNKNLLPETVELLLSRGADVSAINNKGDTALAYAVGFCRPQQKLFEIIKLLVEAGADVNVVDSFGQKVIMSALANVPRLSVKAIEYLVAHGAVIDYTDAELLPKAAIRCQPEAIAFLLNNGANPNNIVLDESETVLDWVEGCTQFLFEYKPDDELGGQLWQGDVARLSGIFKLLVQAGAKRRKELIEL